LHISFELLALLGFCHRQIKASRSHIPVERSPRKAFPTTLNTLGDHIKAKRVEKGLTQRQLAQMLGIGRALLQRWECDCQVPNQKDWHTLVDFLGLDTGSKPSDPTAE
jgi:ribosome-binding protein aMBF1 (putative translation factor)